MKKYAAKLFFQFYLDLKKCNPKRRLTVSSIVVLDASTAKEAYKKAEKKGFEKQYDYVNDEGNSVFFQFIGIEDLLHLGLEADEDEVWYDIKERLLPMERKDRFIPSIEQLSAFKNE